jgi:hypothetical protein
LTSSSTSSESFNISSSLSESRLLWRRVKTRCAPESRPGLSRGFALEKWDGKRSPGQIERNQSIVIFTFQTKLYGMAFSSDWETEINSLKTWDDPRFTQCVLICRGNENSADGRPSTTIGNTRVMFEIKIFPNNSGMYGVKKVMSPSDVQEHVR